MKRQSLSSGICAALLGLFSTVLWAHDVETINAFGNTNYAGAIIASDALQSNPAYDRDALRMSATVAYTNNGLTSATFNYALHFSLLDGNGAPVQVYDAANSPSNAYIVNDSVTLSGLTGALRNYPLSGDIPLVPVSQLDPDETYTTVVKIYEGATLVAFSFDNTPLTFQHFTSTVNGDPNYNATTKLDSIGWTRNWMVENTSTDTFRAQATYTLSRYDNFFGPASSPATHNIPVRFDLVLKDSGGTAVPLVNDYVTFSQPMPTYAYSATAPNHVPASASFISSFDVEPSNLASLDPTEDYTLDVTISHIDDPTLPAVLTQSNDLLTLPSQLLRFNGNLYFGSVLTNINDVVYVQSPGLVSGANVETDLILSAGGGQMANAGHTFGDGSSPMDVRLEPSGTAYFLGGSGLTDVPVTPPSLPDEDVINGVTIQRVAPVTLGTYGAIGSIRVRLPSGFGYTDDPVTKVLQGWFEISGSVSLDDGLAPTSSAFSYSTGSTFWVCEETRPFLLGIQALDWNVGGGTFALNANNPNDIQYVRRDELNYLDAVAGTLVNSDKNLKRSNEQYFRFVETYDFTSAFISVDGNGAAQLNATVNFFDPPGGGSNDFTTHFPNDVEISWDGSGTVVITAGEIGSSSVLNGVFPISIDYARDCDDLNCPGTAGSTTVTIEPTGNKLIFTEDGGLTAPGSLASVTDLQWGYISALNRFAQEALGFSDGTFHMSGHWLGAGKSPKADDHGPGVLLLTGVDDLGAGIERAGASPYLVGDGWYAGVNFDTVADNAHQGRSVVAGNDATLPYDLNGRSKYYVRTGGVTGIHQAMPGAFNPGQLYGYTVDLTSYGFSYLDMVNIDSRTEGNLSLPAPSQFDLDFSRLMLTCRGEVDSLDMDSATEEQNLTYWNGDFQPLSMDFERDPALACSPGEGYLSVNVMSWMSHVPNPFYGTLGFFNDGTISSAANPTVPGRDSRLNGPSTLYLPGPDEEVYVMNLVTPMYYNDHGSAGGAEGFLSVAGTINVPFFKDMKVHLHTRGDKESELAPIHLMGGWPDNGWDNGGDNFFNTFPFDEANAGYPTGTSVDFYRNVGRSEYSEAYLPRAQQSWLGVVNFDYPMEWDSFGKYFTSPAFEDKFLIVEVEHHVPYLSARSAEMKFGAKWDGVPQISLGGLAHQLVGDKVIAPFRAAVDDGKQAMQDMLNDQVSKMFDGIFEELAEPVIDELYDALKDGYDQAAAGTPTNQPIPFGAWQTEYNYARDCYITGPSPTGCNNTNLYQVMNDIVGHVDDVSGLIKQVDGYLEKIEITLDAFTGSFKDPSGAVLSDTAGMFQCPPGQDINMQFAQELVRRLLTDANIDIGIDPSIIAQLIDNQLDPLFQKHKDTFKRIAEKMLQLRNFVSNVRAVLQDGGAFVDNLLDELQSMQTQIQDVVTQIDNGVQGFFNHLDSIGALTGSPFDEYSKEEIKTMIKQEMLDAFYSSEVGTRLQNVIKQYLFDTNGAICQGIDTAFGQLNDIIKELLASAFADLDDKIVPFLDKLNGIVGAGDITGYANIVDDAIRYARLDAHLEWEIPEKMEFTGFIEIKQLNAEGSENACYAESPGVINEVTVGAINTPLNWISEGVRADIYGKATFQTDPGFKLLGIGGGFEMTEGEIKFEKFRITQLGAALALGKEETFLAAKAHAVFESVEAGIGAFFGKTCTIEPLEMVDADVASILGSAPFTGAYLYGEAWIPVLDYGCLLRLSAGAGIGLGYFKEGPTYIGKMKLGVSGEAICIVSVRGEIVLIGVKQGGDFRFKGTGTVSGSVGKCKWFCIKFKKSVTIEK